MFCVSLLWIWISRVFSVKVGLDPEVHIACGVDTPVVAQLRRRLGQLIVFVMG